ncbi:MAG: FtsQ-type POTRA domain-containing protein [Actinomycetota bacterium]
MRRPDGFDHRPDEGQEERTVDAAAPRPWRRRADAALGSTPDASADAGRPVEAADGDEQAEPAEPPRRRWALSAYEGLEDDAPQPTAEPVPERGSHAQRVDREWRAAEKDRRAEEREQAREAKRAAAQARRARIRSERAEVRRFTAGRRRQLRAGLLTAGGLVLALLLLVGLVWSPLMAVREVRVAGADRLDPAAVQAALGSHVGEPIATVTEAGVAAQLQAIPQIESFRLDVVPPSTMIVHIVERRPVAIVPGDGGERVIDAAGVELGGVDAASGSLPRLVGVEPGSPEFEAVATVLVSVPTEVLSTTQSIEAPTASDIRLTLASGQVVQWGGAEESVLKADVVAALIATQDPEVARVLDVRAPDHPVVRGS